jgi:hypothetical protein
VIKNRERNVNKGTVIEREKRKVKGERNRKIDREREKRKIERERERKERK